MDDVQNIIPNKGTCILYKRKFPIRFLYSLIHTKYFLNHQLI